MKIVYVAQSFVPSRRANSIHVMNICSALAKMGHDVTILLPKMENDEDQSKIFEFYGLEPDFKIEKLFFPTFKGKTVCFSLAIYRALNRIQPDYVVGRFLNGCFISSLMGIPTTFDSHGPIWENGRLTTWLFKRMLNLTAFKKITLNSNALKEIYLKSGIFKGSRFDTKNLVVAHNGANIYDLNKKVILPGRKDKLKVGYFGHLYVGRGIEIILELAKRIPEIDFYIAGGEEKDIDYWKNRVQYKNLRFLGYIPFANVYKYRNSCDILLAPYQKVVSPGEITGDQGPYMNPIKYLEYMSSKKAIVASDLPSTREVLNEKNAILVEYNNADQWEKAVRSLAENPDASLQLAERAYQDFEKQFTWKIRAERLIEGAI
jgi:glycosyltransferase involved in cell wall biosynthesis